LIWPQHGSSAGQRVREWIEEKSDGIDEVTLSASQKLAWNQFREDVVVKNVIVKFLFT
jgi:hypothetical protein